MWVAKNFSCPLVIAIFNFHHYDREDLIYLFIYLFVFYAFITFHLLCLLFCCTEEKSINCATKIIVAEPSRDFHKRISLTSLFADGYSTSIRVQRATRTSNPAESTSVTTWQISNFSTSHSTSRKTSRRVTTRGFSVTDTPEIHR